MDTTAIARIKRNLDRAGARLDRLLDRVLRAPFLYPVSSDREVRRILDDVDGARLAAVQLRPTPATRGKAKRTQRRRGQ
jgi:hypothetical protein